MRLAESAKARRTRLDARISIESCIAEGDTAVSRWAPTDTHQGRSKEFRPLAAR
jgi:hypothetical protein